ncbi:MAG: PfkB family carbohydrate kinase [Patescibacteria group bacterium]
MLDLMTVGDIKLDTFILVPDASVMCALHMPDCKLCIAYGKKIPVTAMTAEIAGTAPNVAVGVAKFQKKTGVVSVMGNDDIHAHAKAFLKRHGVSATHVVAKPGVRSSAATVLTYKGESTQFVDHAHVEYRLPDTTKHASWVHISELGEGYEQLYADAIAMKKHHGTRISFNPGTVQIAEEKTALFSLLRVTDILFVNMNEARSLLHIQNGEGVHGIVAGLHHLGAGIVVLTDGANGAYAFDGTTLTFAPIFSGDRIEATGAGDAFSAGFLGAMLHKLPLGESLQFGSANAAAVIGQVGPTAGLKTFADLQKTLASNPTYTTKTL